jgi:hypothetical protein
MRHAEDFFMESSAILFVRCGAIRRNKACAPGRGGELKMLSGMGFSTRP